MLMQQRRSMAPGHTDHSRGRLCHTNSNGNGNGNGGTDTLD
jgi:hypothetical protein